MAFDVAAALRRLKPEKRTGSLAPRPDRDLVFVDQAPAGGTPLLLDTTVYIDVLQGRAPQALKDLLRTRQLLHSSVAVGELTHLFGRLDPAHRDTKAVLSQIRGVISDIPAHRLSTPGVQAVAEAGIVTGIMARLTGLSRAGRQPFMNDAMLFLHALQEGAALVSGNIADMDMIGQIVPAGRVLLYRQV